MKGTCGLCHKEDSELKNSHLLPRALYKNIRNKTNCDPTWVSPSRITTQSRQIRDFFLCGKCEGKFSERGEKWVLENYPQNNGTFPLQKTLLAEKPIGWKGDDRFYNATPDFSVGFKKLSYFGISVFWRACAHAWSLLDRDQPLRLKFGPYENALRLFLNDEGPFPEDAALQILVSTSTVPHDGVLFPSTYGDKPFHRHSFSIPGIVFALFPGKGIPKEEKEKCSVHNGIILPSDTADRLANSASAKLIRKRPLP